MSLQITWRKAPQRLGMVFRKTAQVDPLAPLARGDALPREPAIYVSRPGPPGPPGDGASVRIDVASAGTWIVPHGFGRAPAVDTYLASGEKIVTDVTAGENVVTVTHSVPRAGYVMLS